jgi:hypothetical protein
MVYVAAFAPEEGETLGGMAAKYPTPPAYSEFRQVDDGYLVLTEKGVWESFAQDLSSAEQSLVFAVQGCDPGHHPWNADQEGCSALQTQLVCHRLQRSHDRGQAPSLCIGRRLSIVKEPLLVAIDIGEIKLF